MVSPSKKKKADRKGRETQTQTPLSNVNLADSTRKPTSKSSSRKPLATKKVYLDIRSAAVLTKLEKDLKQLGAKVEPFLDTDIDYFVTDRPTLTSKCNLVNPVQPPTTPSPFVAVVGGPSPSPSPGGLLTAGSVPSPSPGGGGGGNVVLRAGQGGSSSHHHVTRSRAEAMLDCVRAPLLANDVTALNSSHTTVDPIENARAHNVPVYQVQQFVRWVEKLVERTRAGGSGGAARRVKVLNKEFLKLECARRRPEFRELKAWPTLRYEGTPGGPFETRGGGGGGTRQAASGKKQQPQRQNNATGDRQQRQQQQQQRSSRRAADRMTRKDTGVSGGGGGGGGGYCEMCCLDYGDLSQHVTSAGHLKLAQDPAHFAALDSLIRDACLDTLLGNGTTQATVTNHCGVVLSPLNVSDYTNNNKNNNSRRVLRSARASVAPPQNGVAAAACAGMGNRTSSSSPTNGHHNTRSSQHRTAANTNAVVKVVPHSPNEVSNSPPAAAPSNVANGIINHNHLTRLSVRTDLAAAVGGGGVGLATPTLAATPPSAQPTNDSEAGRTRQQQQQSGGGGGTSSRSSTCGESASAATCGQHLLRSKKQLRLPHALQGTTAEGEEEGKRRRCKMRRRRRKRLSVEEKLIEDNRSYYKVEVLNSKLRSTGYYMSQRELELNRTGNSNRGGSGGEHSVANSVAAAAASAASVANSTNAAANSCSMSPPLPQDAAAVGTPEKQPVVMRFKKVRKSELSLLSDEAENFMFGDTSRQQQHHHHLRSSDHDDDDDDEYGADEEELEDEEDNTTSSRSQPSGGGGGSAAPLAADESSQCSSFGTSQRRKRRTHAELFINDNLDYYKFDLMSGSRLRQGGGGVKVEGGGEAKRRGEEGGVMVHVKIKEEIKEEAHSEAEDEPGEEEEEYGKELTADEVAFAFESAPVHESWYQTYRRQDEAREHHTQAYHTYPRLRLPYEYRDKHKRRLLAQAAASGGKAAFAFKRRKKRGGALNSGVLGKRGLSALDDKPRKSPRCHASTLAILSTLKYRRRRISPQQLSQLSPTLSSAAAASPSLVTPTKLSTDDGPISRPTLPEDSVKVGGRRRRPVEDFVALADSLDNYFCEFYFENGGRLEDRYASTMQKLRDAWVECHSGGSAGVGEEEEAEAKKEESVSPSTSKRLAKPKHSASTSSSDSEPHCCCTRDVDPSIFDDYSWLWGDFAGSAGDFAGPRGDFADSAGGLFAPGPQETDFLQLLAGYRQCNSMERALYGAHTINPKAVDSLRRNVMTSSTVVGGTAADSCASSECGGSSTGELLGFTEDGRMLSSKRRKRKKRNMTGWPKDKPKKLLIQQQLKMAAAATPASSSGCSRSLQKVEEEGEEADTSLVLKLRRPKDDAATADDDNSSCDVVKVRRCRGLSSSVKDDAIVDDDNSSGDVVKVRRCRGLSLKDDAIVDDEHSSGDVVKVRRCRGLSLKDDAIVDDDNSSGGDCVKVRRCRGLSSVKDDAAVVDDDNSSGGDFVKVRRCRVVSVSEVDDNSDVLTRSVDGSSRRMRGALRRRAASMTSATAGRRGRGRGGRGRGLRR